MVQAVRGDIAKQGRVKSGIIGNLRREGRVQYIGARVQQVGEGAQVYLVEMEPDSVIEPHFHQVDQFQVMVSGGGTLGRNAMAPIFIHYADHSTAYGPINSGPCGLSFFTVRARSDPGGVYLADPEFRKMLKPTKKRYLLAEGVLLSTEPVLEHRSTLAMENLLPDADDSDGLGAHMLRMGRGMKTTGPDPRKTAGICYLVANGELQLDDTGYRPWSAVYAAPTDAPLEICAGSAGLEAIVLSFPRHGA